MAICAPGAPTIGLPGINAPSASSPASSSAVHFDGSTFLARGAQLTGVSDAPTGIFSFWVNSVSFGSSALFSDNTFDCSIFRDAQDLQWSLFNAPGSNNKAWGDFDVNGTGFLADGLWHHYLVSWNTNFDAGSRIFIVYLDDVQNTNAPFHDSGVAYSVGYHQATDWQVGAGFDTPSMTADLAEFYFAPGQFLDFTDEANRRKFSSVDNHPVSLGASGSLPTGTAPIIYFSGDAAGFATNLGTGGAFAVTGTLTNASTNP